MASYIIEGGRRLEGEVGVSPVLKCLITNYKAATILNPNITKLYNIPNIHDTQITLEILKYLGCKLKKKSW